MQGQQTHRYALGDAYRQETALAAVAVLAVHLNACTRPPAPAPVESPPPLVFERSVVDFLNSVEGMKWTRFKVADQSAYNARVGDIDDDRDMDIVTSSSWEDPPIMLWRNQLIE
jgi:hypothetical protein